MNVIGKKNIFFLISAIIILPGIISLIFFGLRFSIEFTGGTLLEVKAEEQSISIEQVKKTIEENGAEISTIQETSDGTILMRLKTIDPLKNRQIQEILAKETGKKITEVRYETVGPTIGQELAGKALTAIVVASFMIILYIAWAFRKVPRPASSWRFGACAIVALVHDVLVVVGAFSLLGHFYHVEIDSLFVTALLTVIGFSVHDTIVVFDRVRENLGRLSGHPFNYIVNESVIQTLVRSISTSVTVVITLYSLFLFSRGNLRWFVVALLIGIISGTYSSIFNAAPLLVVWQEHSDKRVK